MNYYDNSLCQIVFDICNLSRDSLILRCVNLIFFADLIRLRYQLIRGNTMIYDSIIISRASDLV